MDKKLNLIQSFKKSSTKMVSNNINKAFNQLDNIVMTKVEEHSEKNSDIDTTDYHINVETPDLVIENDSKLNTKNINNIKKSDRRESENDGHLLISPETSNNVKKKNRRSSDGVVDYVPKEIKLLDEEVVIKKTVSQRSLCESPNLSVQKRYLGDNAIFSNSNLSVSSN